MTAAWFQKKEDGIVLCIKASPGAKKTGLLSIDPHAPWIRIAISSPPEKGKANEALLCFIAKMFDISPSFCTISSGATAHKKRVGILKTMDYDTCMRILQKAVL